MRKTFSIALSTGVGIASIFVLVLSFFTLPIKFAITFMCYAIIFSCAITGFLVHKRFCKEKRRSFLSHGFSPFFASITLRNGKKIKGIVISISHGFVVCKPLDKEEELAISFREIKKLEIS